MSSPSNNRRVSHPAYVSSCWEISGIVASTLSANVGYRVANSGIGCSGIEGNEPFEHPVQLTAYTGSGVVVTVGDMYFAKAKFFAPNDLTPTSAVHEHSHVVHLGNAETFPGALINNTAISAIGIIVSKRVVQEANHEGRPTTVCIVRHTDYNPVVGANVEFNIEYWCRPVRNLTKAQNLFQRGREVTLFGYITGKDVQRHMWQVDVYAVSVATGHESLSTPTAGTSTAVSQTTAAGRVRLPRYSAAVGNNSPASSINSPAP
ncbi:uncharacterized protein MELLADRAFT_67841 [Melampsora larici-populina 98AG31]|uniref:Uncharacterized protein n=1 Tax=Melampsora larici-populina (strain 98AG31 / pathotype 3-4-7) TaxID=747676 RepID=F4S4M4_MELLP|nr:uncharacterized protein MELLADRAFT_67841 [Melampsora larici-populina 98AG31]EGG00445.1 hypothetical protein MELLADRAFT_67841 [Melampsora larici-populina 98AG31]